MPLMLRSFSLLRIIWLKFVLAGLLVARLRGGKTLSCGGKTSSCGGKTPSCGGKTPIVWRLILCSTVWRQEPIVRPSRWGCLVRS